MRKGPPHKPRPEILPPWGAQEEPVIEVRKPSPGPATGLSLKLMTEEASRGSDNPANAWGGCAALLRSKAGLEFHETMYQVRLPAGMARNESHS